MSYVAAIALASVIAAPVPKADPIQEDKQNFQGEWKLVQFIRDGRATPRDEATSRFSIKGDRLITPEDDGDIVTLTLDPKPDPKTIDLKITERDREYVLKGIYKLEKDRLTICFAMEDKERPKEFQSVAKSEIRLIVLERVKTK